MPSVSLLVSSPAKLLSNLVASPTSQPIITRHSLSTPRRRRSEVLQSTPQRSSMTPSLSPTNNMPTTEGSTPAPTITTIVTPSSRRKNSRSEMIVGAIYSTIEAVSSPVLNSWPASYFLRSPNAKSPTVSYRNSDTPSPQSSPESADTLKEGTSTPNVPKIKIDLSSEQLIPPSKQNCIPKAVPFIPRSKHSKACSSKQNKVFNGNPKVTPSRSFAYKMPWCSTDFATDTPVTSCSSPKTSCAELPDKLNTTYVVEGKIPEKEQEGPRDEKLVSYMKNRAYEVITCDETPIFNEDFCPEFGLTFRDEFRELFESCVSCPCVHCKTLMDLCREKLSFCAKIKLSCDRSFVIEDIFQMMKDCAALYCGICNVEYDIFSVKIFPTE